MATHSSAPSSLRTEKHYVSQFLQFIGATEINVENLTEDIFANYISSVWESIPLVRTALVKGYIASIFHTFIFIGLGQKVLNDQPEIFLITNHKNHRRNKTFGSMENGQR